MENTYLDSLLFVGAFCVGMALAAGVLCTSALLGEIASRYFGRWRSWVVFPLSVLMLFTLTVTLFWVMVALPHEGVIPWWVSVCIGVVLVIGGLVFGIWGLSDPEGL